MCLEREVKRGYCSKGLRKGRIRNSIGPSNRGPLHCMLSKSLCHLDRGVCVCVCARDIWMIQAFDTLLWCFSFPLAWISPPHHTSEINLLTSCFVCMCVYEWVCCLSLELLTGGVWFHSYAFFLFYSVIVQGFFYVHCLFSNVVLLLVHKDEKDPKFYLFFITLI